MQLAQAQALRELHQRVTLAVEQGHGRDGMAAFIKRTRILQPHIDNARANGDHEELHGLLQRQRHWQAGAINEVMDALGADATVCCDDVWARYSLDQDRWQPYDITGRIWTMLISGKENRYEHSRRIQMPETFNGPIVRALAQRQDPDRVCETFHITDAKLRSWLHLVAPVLTRGASLGEAHQLPFNVGI